MHRRAAAVEATSARDTEAELRSASTVDVAEAARFLELYYDECATSDTYASRMRQVLQEVDRTGTYVHTRAELEHGARVAWRNSSRCIGRLYWRSLKVRDLRQATTVDEIHHALCGHLQAATNGGRIRPVLTVFRPDSPGEPGPRIRNDQLIRYAGHRQPDGAVVGDPANLDLTEHCRDLGWEFEGGGFDLLPLLIQPRAGRSATAMGVPRGLVLEVELRHPEYPWFADLGLRWHAVPVISNMRLRIGGIDYGLAPFNGWYMGTEIGARNLVDEDRYDLLPVVAEALGLDTSSESSLWRDRSLVEVNVAVLHSFETDGVRISDHHSEARRFVSHLAKEARAGRPVPADWSWIVPPMSGSLTPVFHRYYDDEDLRPNFYHADEPSPAIQARPDRVD